MWKQEDGYHECMFFVNEYHDAPNFNEKDGQRNIRKHILLEFLHNLKVLEYSRGYDGYYYTIHLKVKT